MTKAKATTKTSKTTVTQPMRHHSYILNPRKDDNGKIVGYDLIDPLTGRWASFPTQRYAKWSSTFVHNIEARFNANPVLKSSQIPNVQEAA